MLGVVIVGFVGGVLTGLSPCILPVLPVVLSVSVGRKPTRVVAGLTLSFAAIALLGSLVLGLLHLPQSLLRWGGIVLLALVGIGMFVPQVGELLQKPFDALPRPTVLQEKARGKGGFLIGMALGAVYAPCAGPVLAAVTVAGSTGEIGWSTVALTLSFAAGSALPLLAFAFAGNRIGQKVDLVQRHRRLVGAVILVFTLALALDAPVALQRSLPDWTAGVKEKFETSQLANDALGQVSQTAGSFDECRRADPGQLQDCGPAPEFAGLENWINTASPDAGPTPHDGKVTLVDFWAYACINCQRAGEHITALYDTYRDSGLEVVGVHSPEYGFEHDLGNVKRAVEQEGIHYPVAQDNDFLTWRNYGNRYWPARYLIDTEGNVRQIVEGEGSYAETEQLIRALLADATNAPLPNPIEQSSVTTGVDGRNPETYLGTKRASYTANADYTPGQHDFGTQSDPQRGQFVLNGRWELGPESIAAEGGHLAINVYAAWVQLVVSGQGSVEVEYPDGTTKTFEVSDGTIDLLKQSEPLSGVVRITPDAGVRLYSLTFG
ncbi:cytochrome c biogenesis protein CcdA [Corynebacterium riegelii]|uniref:cytochrome c biogenesis protein CcdA n=1 Tax=Corynebacterium riegelii TaxID=156976 RepID=UPI00254AF996|nr:cytochrome c biogenesis protein CcdA [Corynebacterium riegelii]MDK7179678.1 cytochrome c biogenesis protein CcdA [Corynebacterium riegelii]